MSLIIVNFNPEQNVLAYASYFGGCTGAEIVEKILLKDKNTYIDSLQAGEQLIEKKMVLIRQCN